MVGGHEELTRLNVGDVACRVVGDGVVHEAQRLYHLPQPKSPSESWLRVAFVGKTTSPRASIAEAMNPGWPRRLSMSMAS